MKNKKTIVLVGADTGGHVVPVFALAKEFLKKTKHNVVIIGVGSKIEKRFYSKLPGIKYKTITAGKFQFRSFINNSISILKTLVGFFQSFYLLIIQRPAVVFLKGNYATIPVAYAARILRIPVFAHESDAVVGKSNKLIAKFAKKMFFSYPLEIYGYHNPNGVYSGPILRPEISATSPKNYHRFGFRDKVKTILIIGGSQGASSINKVILESLDKLLLDYQLIHLTGERDLAMVEAKKTSLEKKYQRRYFISAFINDPEIAISTADLVVSRSSSTIFELAAMSKLVILIPYPYASLDHQVANAKYFQNNNAVIVLDDKNLTPSILYSTISKIFSTPKKQLKLKSNIFNCLKQNGIDMVFQYLEKVIRK